MWLCLHIEVLFTTQTERWRFLSNSCWIISCCTAMKHCRRQVNRITEFIQRTFISDDCHCVNWESRDQNESQPSIDWSECFYPSWLIQGDQRLRNRKLYYNLLLIDYPFLWFFLQMSCLGESGSISSLADGNQSILLSGLLMKGSRNRRKNSSLSSRKYHFATCNFVPD